MKRKLYKPMVPSPLIRGNNMVLDEEQEQDNQPKWSHKTLKELLQESKEYNSKTPSLIELSPEHTWIVASDLHGDTLTLNQVLSEGNYRLILGDLLDYNPDDGSSIDALATVIDRQLSEPDKVKITQADHEQKRVFSNRQTWQELIKNYEPEQAYELADLIEDTCSQFPYAAISQNGILMLHGTIPRVDSLDRIRELPKGVTDVLGKADETGDEETKRIVADITWGDNTYKDNLLVHTQDADGRKYAGEIKLGPEGWGPNTQRSNSSKRRKKLIVVGADYIDKQMEKLGIKGVIRGHNHFQQGVNLDGRVLTIITGRQFRKPNTRKGTHIAYVNPTMPVESMNEIPVQNIMEFYDTDEHKVA